MKKREAVWEFIMITFAIVIVATAVFFFLIPSHVSVGSISGLAVMLRNFIPLKIFTITFVLNIFLLILGFLFTEKGFGSKTVYILFLLPVVLTVFELMFPDSQSITNGVFLDMFCYIFMVSIGLAMLFNRDAPSGGLGIVAKFPNRYLYVELSKAMSLAGMCAASPSVLVYDRKVIVLSILGTYLDGTALDHFISSFNIRKRVCIISEHGGKIREFILHHLHSGATIYEAIGVYGKKPRREIVTIVGKSEYFMLMAFVLKTGKDVFVTIYTVNEVVYRPKC